MNNAIDRKMAIDFFLSKGMITAAVYVERMPSVDVPAWIPCNEPPEDDRSVFIARNRDGITCYRIGYYDPSKKQWREPLNFLDAIIQDAMYWCDMPKLPESSKKGDTNV